VSEDGFFRLYAEPINATKGGSDMNLKKEVSPPVAIAVIVVLVIALIVGYMAMTGSFSRGVKTAKDAGAGPPMYPGVIPGQNNAPVAPITPGAQGR
jgi:flagellar basal body-associated protein FliL